MGMNHKTFLAVFRKHNEDYAKLVGKMKSQRSYWKYRVVYKHLEEFIKQRYKMEDIALKELTPALYHRFRSFFANRERSLHQYCMVVYDASQKHHIYGYQQKHYKGERLLCHAHWQ